MMIRPLFLTLAAFTSPLIADVEDYLMPVEDKSGYHAMRGIDFIYMINLDERPEKLEKTLQELSPYGITPCRFSAVNGWKLPLDVIDDLGVRYGPWMSGGKMGTYYPLDSGGEPKHELVQVIGRNYFSHCMARGAMGCALSHLSVLQDAHDSGYETIWVMEDDIEVIKNPHLLSELIVKLDNQVGKDGWDILYTDQETINAEGHRVTCWQFAWRPNFTPPNPAKCLERYDVGSDFRYVGARYGTYSMIVRRSGMKKILNFFQSYNIFLPYDLEYPQMSDMRLYTVRDDVVSTHITAPSDNGAPTYEASP